MDWLLLILGLYLSWGLLRVILGLARGGNSAHGAGQLLPPGPRRLPVIGNLLELGSQPHKSLAMLARAYGPIMSLKMGCITTVVISSAPMAREILQVHDAAFCHRFIFDSMTIDRHDELGMPVLPVSPLWRNLHRICNAHLFAPKTLNSNQPIRHQKIQQFLTHVGKCCETGSSMDIREAAFTTTLNLLGSTIFSVDLAKPTSKYAKELKEVIEQLMVDLGKPNLADFFPVLKRFDPQGVRRRMSGHTRQLLDVFHRFVSDRMKNREVLGFVRKNDMLDTLLDINEDKQEGINLLLIEHLLMDLFGAGTDTTSSTLEWAMAELLRNPEKLLKVQDELQLVIGRGRPVEESDIARLQYLQAVVKETLRMHPAVPFLLPRKAGSTAQVGGYTIPEGAQILVNVWAIGLDPVSWTNPDVFTPERFLGQDGVDFRGQHFELLPFGGGRRICPGLPLAIRMLHLMLGSLVNCFDWKLEDGISPETMEMGEMFGLTLQKAQPLRAVPLPVKT